MPEKQYLKNIIGADAIKKQITFYLKNFETTGIFKNLLIIGGRGTGKSKLALEISRHLVDSKTKKIRKLIQINCASLTSLDDFFKIVEEHLVDGEVSCHFDEAEQLDKNIAIALLDILAVNSGYKNSYIYQNETYIFDFRKLSFIFSTTNPEKLLEPLVDRLEVVSIPPYKKDDLTKILAHNLNGYKFSNEVLEELASVARGNPRASVKLAQNIDGFLKRNNQTYLDLEDVKKLYQELSVLPLGLTQTELEILRVLKINRNCSLTHLAAALGENVQAVRRFSETFLLKNNLIEISSIKGRNLSTNGAKYLKQLEEIGL